MSDDAQLARAAARIEELAAALAAAQQQLAAAHQARDLAQGEAAAAMAGAAEAAALRARLAAAAQTSERVQAELAAAQAGAAEAAALHARLAELQALCLADPPAGSGIVKVQRFMTADGHKHKLLPDARRAAARLGLLAMGFDERAADLLLLRADEAERHLAVARPIGD